MKGRRERTNLSVNISFPAVTYRVRLNTKIYEMRDGRDLLFYSSCVWILRRVLL